MNGPLLNVGNHAIGIGNNLMVKSRNKGKLGQKQNRHKVVRGVFQSTGTKKRRQNSSQIVLGFQF